MTDSPDTERHRFDPKTLESECCRRMRGAALRNLADFARERNELKQQIGDLRATLVKVATVAMPETEAFRIASEALCGG